MSSHRKKDAKALQGATGCLLWIIEGGERREMNDRDSPSGRDSEPSLGDVIEGAVRKIVTGIVIAGGLIGIGLYSQAGPARYQMIAADGHVYRLNTKSGVIVACAGDRCGF